MEICSNGHKKIVHDEWECPVCAEQDNVYELKQEIEGNQKTITDLENKITDLENKIDELEDIISELESEKEKK